MDMRSWRAADARDLYNIPVWGEGYFDVSDEGHVLVRARRDPSAATVDLFEIANQLPLEGLELTVLIRFAGILHDRVDALTWAFSQVISELGYGGRYTAVYPIKVNQQRRVVEEI